jgi:hydantoinase/carbamoylase family amidase
MATQLKITEGRLLNTIHETAAKWGAAGVWGSHHTETGCCRLALSDLDKGVRDWFVEETKALGCTVKVDEMGSIFAIYPGKNEGPPTGIGSHLDTQPNGGRYDGIYGVLSGLEVLRTMKDNNFVPNFPVAVVDWTNEEGARFPKTCIASCVWAGLVTKEEAYKVESITDKVPVSYGAELERIGYKGTTPSNHTENPLAAHFEIHIEQGPVLEHEKKKIGIVVGAQAYHWQQIIVKGRSSHAGTTPMHTRSDALHSASKMICSAIDIAKSHGGLATIGTISLEPSSVNVIPEKVMFTLDTRHVEDAILETINADIAKEFEKLVEAGSDPAQTALPLEVEHELLVHSEAIKFNETNIATVRQSAIQLFGEENVREITSGAGHDSCSTSHVVPTSMIFIPSKNGISHNPEEYSSPEEVANGFEVLLATIVKYDELRAKNSQAS